MFIRRYGINGKQQSVKKNFTVKGSQLTLEIDTQPIVSGILLRRWLQISQYGHDESVLLLLRRRNTSPDEIMCYYTFVIFLNTCSLFSRVIYFRVLNFSGCKKSAKISENKILAKITGYRIAGIFRWFKVSFFYVKTFFFRFNSVLEFSHARHVPLFKLPFDNFLFVTFSERKKMKL